MALGEKEKSPIRDTNRIGPKHVKIAAAIVVLLAVVLIASISVPNIIKSQKLDITKASYAESEFVLEERASDIDPGHEYVLYTNYACPYCAGFYNEDVGYEYTTRLLLRDNEDSRFDSQSVVCSYMLKLYRTDEGSFRQLENWLYNNQGEWTVLDNEEVLACLNEKSGQAWTIDDLDSGMAELEADKEAIPDDLEFVPAIFSTGKCFNEYMLSLFGV